MKTSLFSPRAQAWADQDHGPLEPPRDVQAERDEAIGEEARVRTEEAWDRAEAVAEAFDDGVHFPLGMAELAGIARRLKPSIHRDRALQMLGGMLLDQIDSALVAFFEAEVRKEGEL